MVGLDALASLLGAGLGSIYGGRTPCECNCSFEHDAGLVSLLRDQLARCGPEQLRSTPCVCSPCDEVWDGWHLLSFGVGFVSAVLLTGCLAAALYLLYGGVPGCAQSSPRRSAKGEGEGGAVPLATTPASLRRALLP